jgi:hypothetical protein
MLTSTIYPVDIAGTKHGRCSVARNQHVQVFFANAHDAGIRYTKTLNYLSPEEFEQKYRPKSRVKSMRWCPQVLGHRSYEMSAWQDFLFRPLICLTRRPKVANLASR